MNLLELMLKEEIEWPVGAEYAAQSVKAEIVFCKYGFVEPVVSLAGTWRSVGGAIVTAIQSTTGRADDFFERIITREEYQAAGGKIAAPSDYVAPSLSAADAATAKQATPKGSGNPILGMVLADLTNRALEGTAKYGEPLKAHNGRNALWDLYQELLDAAMYIRQAIEEQR